MRSEQSPALFYWNQIPLQLNIDLSTTAKLHKSSFQMKDGAKERGARQRDEGKRRQREGEGESETGVNNIFISTRVCSSQSVRHH